MNNLIFKEISFYIKTYSHTGHLHFLRPTSGRVVTLKLEDGRRQVQTLITLVDLAVQSFLWFSPKLA